MPARANCVVLDYYSSLDCDVQDVDVNVNVNVGRQEPLITSLINAMRSRVPLREGAFLNDGWQERRGQQKLPTYLPRYWSLLTFACTFT